MAYYQLAFMHRSKPEDATSSNERLEFLGDAVLSLLISEQLANSLPGSSEGVLSKLKARLVSEASLAAAAKQLDLGAHLLLDERMAALAHHRVAAQLVHDVERVPHQSRVVDDRLTGVFC